MRTAPLLGLVAALLCHPPAARAQNLIDFQGMGWETDGFPPSDPGDSLNIVFVADAIHPYFGINLLSYEVTGRISGLVSSGQVDIGGGVLACAYTGGALSVFVDPSHNHDYGVAPPNETVPSSFIDGSSCMQGNLDSFFLYFDPSTGFGGLETDVTLIAGDCAVQVPPQSIGTLHLVAEITLGDIPRGYDFRVDGDVQLDVIPVYYGLPCFHLTEVELKFPSARPGSLDRHDPGFRIEGEFRGEPRLPVIDPDHFGIHVTLGRYGQSFPRGSFVPGSGACVRWTYANRDTSGAITAFAIELEDEETRQWEFEIRGRGVPREQLLPESNDLDIRFSPVPWYEGHARAPLEERGRKLRYRAPWNWTCPYPPVPPAATPRTAPGAAPEISFVTPNPIHGRATVLLRSAERFSGRLAVYDVRGRLVRELHHGSIAPGPQAFTWDGRDEQGGSAAAGVYIVRIHSGHAGASRKLVLCR